MTGYGFDDKSGAVVGHVDRSLAEASTDFDYEAVARNLGEPVESDNPSAEEKAGEALRRVFDFVIDGNDLAAPNLERVARRLLCLLWVLNPARFDGIPIKELADRLKIHSSKLYPITAEIVRVFGIKNHGQDHGKWARKEAQ